MIRVSGRAVFLLLSCLTFLSLPASSQSSLEKIKSDYQSVSSELQKHIVHDWWIDDAPASPELLARQWSLAAEWVAGWLDEHLSADAVSLRAALAAFAPASEPSCLKLDGDTFLVVAPGSIGNVFIVAKSAGHFRAAWSTAQVQDAHGEEAEVLAALRPENARHGNRGPYYTATGSSGSVLTQIGLLPNDARGRPRFFIDGTYAQSAGGTVGAQISIWLWESATARPQMVRTYSYMVDQAVGTQIEGDLLKVREKKFFRTFFSCGMCEERQTDWTVRIARSGIEYLGETSLVPELDTVDELFYRVIHHKPARDVASPAAISAARRIVAQAQADRSEPEWKKFPSLGMMGAWRVRDQAGGKTLCLSLDDVGTNLFIFKSTGGKLFIAGIKPTSKSCDQ